MKCLSTFQNAMKMLMHAIFNDMVLSPDKVIRRTMSNVGVWMVTADLFSTDINNYCFVVTDISNNIEIRSTKL